MATSFRLQQPPLYKQGVLTKKGKTFGWLINRYYKLGWEGAHAVLLYGSNSQLKTAKKIPLDWYVLELCLN